jgi:hypothetical protein
MGSRGFRKIRRFILKQSNQYENDLDLNSIEVNGEKVVKRLFEDLFSKLLDVRSVRE